MRGWCGWCACDGHRGPFSDARTLPGARGLNITRSPRAQYEQCEKCSMIDHLLGRPSQNIKKVQVLAVTAFWVVYIMRGPDHGPPIARNISRFLSKHATAWQIHVLTMTGLYVLKNIDKLVNLQSPEPLSNIQIVLQGHVGLDGVGRRVLDRDAGQTQSDQGHREYTVRKVRATITAEHLRVSWEKSTSPYLRLTKIITCPRIQVLRAFEISRPPGSPYRSRINAYLYYDGPRLTFKQHTKVLLNFPGGGFVSMTPRHHDDSLCAWAKKLKIPVISINYGKAPEHPYPYSLDECYDAYLEIVRTKGRCIGLSGNSDPQIVLIGDSAGGNFVAGTVLKLLINPQRPRLPISLILVYAALDLNFNSWMTDEQVRLLRQESVKELNSPGLMLRKESTYKGLSGRFQVEDSDVKEFRLPSSVEATEAGYGSLTSANNKRVWDASRSPAQMATDRRGSIGTLLAMTSRVSYFSDKVITPEMLRAMVILYIGPSNRPDFGSDYLLSPINAPAELLEKFPKVYMMCGEVDPLVDDTVLFAGRLREAKRGAAMRMERLSMSRPKEQDDYTENVEVMLIRGISHGFLQIPMLLPEGEAAISRCGAWIQEAFASREPQYPTTREDPTIHGLRVAGEKGSRRRGLVMQAVWGLLAMAGLGWVQAEDEVDDDYFEDDDYDYYFEDDDILAPGWLQKDKDGAQDAEQSPLSASSVDSDEGERAPETSKREKRRKVLRRRPWDKSRLVKEGDLMDRRRNTIVRSLHNTTTDSVETTNV